MARYLFKLMAYKDEYEVARLYTDGAFLKQVETEFDGDNLRFEFHLAPPLLARRDKTTGLPRKMSFGPWMLPAFRLLAKFKGLRGTPFDPFGRSLERRTERKLIGDYEAMLDEVLARSDAGQSSHRGRAGRDPGKDPRLRPRQAAASHRRQGRRSGAARAIPRRRAGRCSKRRSNNGRWRERAAGGGCEGMWNGGEGGGGLRSKKKKRRKGKKIKRRKEKREER